MNNFIITLESCRKVGLCAYYTPRVIVGITQGRESMTALEFTYLDIPVQDIQYQLFKQLPRTIIDRAIELTITRCVTNHALNTPIDEWARRWLSGEDRTFRAARAARAAAWKARAAEAAAEAAWAARVAAAASAAAAAVGAAAAAGAAGAAEEDQLQLDDLRQAIKEAENA